MVSTADLSNSIEQRTAGLLGGYLTALGFCSEATIRKVLERQGELQAKGFSMLIGTLLLDAGAVSEKELGDALDLQVIDRLSCSLLFKSLPREAIERIQPRAEIRSYAPGMIIYRQGEESRSVNIILQGRVNLVHQPEQGTETDFSLLEAGEHFGEMGLLSGSSRFATARAVERTELAEIPSEVFLTLYLQYPKVFQAVIRKWFKSMVDGKLKSQVIYDHYYKELISSKDPLPCIHLVGKSKHARAVRAETKRIAQSGQSALLIGKHGMRLVRLAQEIYENSPYRSGPFIIIDPDDIPLFVSQPFVESSNTVFQQELIQMAALFGYERSAEQGSVPWQGFIKIAHAGVLVIKGMERFTPKVQRLLADYIKSGQFFPVWSSKPSHSTTRIIAIGDDELALEREVVECLAPLTLDLPPLRSRKKDLKDMVQVLINSISEIRRKKIKGIDREALNVIMAYDWPGNYRELEEVIQRAVRLAFTGVLSSEEIFFGHAPISGKNTFNLLKLQPVKHFFQSPFYPRAPRAAIAIMFLVVIILGLWGSPSPDSNISLLLIWANWEPLLILSCLLLARFWCSFCPIGFFNELFLKIKKKRWKISAKHLQKGFFISALGLAVIFWSQAALDMWESPKATAGLLIAMLISASFFALLFEGHVWCQYICPLGQMVATFSRTAILEVRANYNFCSNQCHSYECYTGNGGIEGCKMTKGPFALESNQNCNLCGNCIKVCPNESVRVNLRPPGWELITSHKADLAMLLFVPMLWGTQLFRFVDLTSMPAMVEQVIGPQLYSYALLMMVSVMFAYFLAATGWVITKYSFPPGKVEPSRFVFAMLPLVYANEIAIRLAPLLNHAADFFVILGNQIGYEFPQIAFRLDMGSIFILQIVLIAVGFLFSIYILNIMLKEFASGFRFRKVLCSLPLFLMITISIVLLWQNFNYPGG